MTFIHYYYPILPDLASHEEALIAITSSQILLSREIADTYSPTVQSPEILTSTLVTSIFETNNQHIMTLGDAADLNPPLRAADAQRLAAGTTAIHILLIILLIFC